MGNPTLTVEFRGCMYDYTVKDGEIVGRGADLDSICDEWTVIEWACVDVGDEEFRMHLEMVEGAMQRIDPTAKIVKTPTR